MSAIKNRYLICSSIGQIINTKAAFFYLEKSNKTKFIYNDYIIVINPNISNDLIIKMDEISKKLNFKKIIDLRKFYIGINKINKHIKFSINFKENKKNINYIIKNFEEFNAAIKVEILKYEKPDVVFIRNNYNIIDSHLLTNLHYKKIFKIEDGIGDYHSWFSKFTKLHEIFHYCKSIIKKLIKFLFIFIFSRKFQLTNEFIFKKNFIYHAKFLNIKKNNFIYIKNEYLKTISKFKSNEKKEIKVIIIGTLLNLKNNITLNKEVDLYNRLINQIKFKYRINSNNIWYKPHPRIDKKELIFKKKFMKCNILYLANDEIIETYLKSKYLAAIYSIGSTSLLFSKLFFNKNAYCVKFQKIKFHPSIYKLEHLIYKKFKVKIIKI